MCFPGSLVWIWQSCLPGVCFPWTVGLDLAVLLTWCVFSLNCWSGSGSPAYLLCVFPELLVWIWQSCLPGVCFPWTVGLDLAVLLTWCVFSLDCWSGSGSPVGLDLAVLLTWCVFSLDCWSGSGSPAYLVCVFPGSLVWIWQSCLPGVFSLDCWSGSGSPAYLLCVFPGLLVWIWQSCLPGVCFPGLLVWIWQSCLPGVCFPWTVGLDLAVLLTWCVFSLDRWSGSGSPAYLVCVFPGSLVWIWQSCLPGVCFLWIVGLDPAVLLTWYVFPWTVGLDLAVLLTWCVFSLDRWSGSGSPAYLVCVFPESLVWIWQSCLPGVCFLWIVGLDPAVLLTWYVFSLDRWSVWTPLVLVQHVSVVRYHWACGQGPETGQFGKYKHITRSSYVYPN